MPVMAIELAKERKKNDQHLAPMRRLRLQRLASGMMDDASTTPLRYSEQKQLGCSTAFTALQHLPSVAPFVPTQFSSKKGLHNAASILTGMNPTYRTSITSTAACCLLSIDAIPPLSPNSTVLHKQASSLCKPLQLVR
ncbi:hypothetical protein GOP47_0011013 [Adiantum capillus-veneris]|uniref:Uncharacterized protein n=1 Tax=Adiantum capillus-veneris TaxID=13818 RepID=A0A9D4ZID9_ADICA|nr:hypothetical protein GOP47_0011013 [Adiantum capillus-veneris]